MQDPYLHIEEYIAGNLSVEDSVTFESAMASDKRLRQAVEDFNLVGLIGEALLEEEIAGIVGEEMDRNDDGNTINDSNHTNFKVLKWLVAAGLVLLLGWWGSSLFTQKTDAELFAEVLVDPAWLDERSDGDNVYRHLTAMHRRGETSRATDSLKSIKTSESAYWLSELYLREQKFDSTLLYLQLDLLNDDKLRRDRKLYLHIIALYFSGDHFSAKTAYESLPDDVDKWYLERLNQIN